MTSASHQPSPAGVRCDLCGSLQGTVILAPAPDYITGSDFSVWQCSACGLARTVPRPSSMDRYYPAVYRRYSGFTLRALTLLYRWRVRGWIRRLPTNGLALDVGCGDGWMLAALRRRGWKVVGVERSIDGARSAAAVNGISTLVGDLDALRPSSGFHLVILFQALEHLDDPLRTLKQCAELLAPRGTLIVAVPNFSSWQARAFGAWWFHLDVPRHQNHFSPRTLSTAFERIGLRVVRTRFVSPEHDPYGWLQSTLNRMGFRQNLLTRVLMGLEGQHAMLKTMPMFVVSTVLALPCVLLALCSWPVKSGAIMEMWGAKE